VSVRVARQGDPGVQLAHPLSRQITY